MGGHKTYQDPEWFTCCVGTGMETHSKYGAHIYYHNDHELYLSQYIASTVNWKEKELVLTQETNFPEEQASHFTFSLKKPIEFTFLIRYPHWAENGIEIEINRKSQKVDGKKGSYLAIKRLWKNGDRVDVHFPFSLRLETMPDDADRIAFFHGPLLLAGDFGPYAADSIIDIEQLPVLLSETKNPEVWLEPSSDEANCFKTKAVGLPNDFFLKPFYKLHDRFYSVYFDIYSDEKWERHKIAYQEELKRKQELEESTYDAFQPGEMQPERDHNFAGEKLNMMEDFKNRKARGAERGGWLSFDMKVKRGSSMALVIEYWGGFTGSKTFDILVDGVKVATENISGKKDGEFIDVQYEIPSEIIDGKETITVKFDPHAGHRAGPFFYARTVFSNDK
jgi:hypothetical protein